MEPMFEPYRNAYLEGRADGRGYPDLIDADEDWNNSDTLRGLRKATNVTVEDLARELHESGRAAVESGATVAADKFDETARKFMGWAEISKMASEGRRIQAQYLLNRYSITRLPF